MNDGDLSENLTLPRDVGVFAIDGGAMCGVAALAHNTFVQDELTPRSTLKFLNALLRQSRMSFKWHVVAERWDSAGRSSRPMTAQVAAIETNGAARWISEQCGAIFELQSRGEAKKVMTDATLRRLGWFKKTKDGHANDAARHLGLAFLHHFPVEYMRLIELV